MPDFYNTTSNTLVAGTSSDDYIENRDDNVTISAGNGNDKIYNYNGASVIIYAGDGNDSVHNYGNDSVTIDTGAGNDTVYNSYGSEETSINTDAGNDYVYIENGSNVTITTGAGNDLINNFGSDIIIIGSTGNDTIYNDWNFSENRQYGYSDGSNVVFKYSEGDGNDKIYGFRADSTLSIGGGSYSSKKSGDNIIVTVGDGKITLVGAKNLSKVNIKGTKTSNSKNIFSNVNITDFDGESKESVRTKAIAGLKTLLKTDMSDVVLKNVDGLKTLDDPTRKKLSSLSSIFKLANEAESSFGVLGNLCSSAETFLGLVQSKKRDATWGKQVSDCVKNLLKFGNAVLKLSDKKLAKSLGLGLGGSLFGLVGSIVATTDGITDTERDNIVKDVFSVGGEFAKLIIPATKTSSMEIDLVTATASALYMGDVQMQKSLEQSPASGMIYLMPNFVSAKIDSVTVSLDEFARKMTKGASDVFLSWLDEKTGGNAYSNMTYTQKASEGFKILFKRTLIGNVKLANNISNAISNWWTQLTETLNQKGVNLKGDSKNNVLLGGAKKDTLSGGAGDDKLYGQDGNDSLVGGDGKDTISGGKGDDKLYGNAGNDSLVGGDGKDTLSGGAGDDKLYGDSGKDSLNGGAGNDSLWGGAGDDILTGGSGKDVFFYASNDGNDVIADFSSNDMIKLTNGSIKNVTKSGNDVTFKIGSGSIKVQNVKGKEITVVDSENTTRKYLNNKLISKSKDDTFWFATDGTEKSFTVNGNIYTVNDDYNGITITKNGKVDGLDAGATLSFKGEGDITVNDKYYTFEEIDGNKIRGYEKKVGDLGYYLSSYIIDEYILGYDKKSFDLIDEWDGADNLDSLSNEPNNLLKNVTFAQSNSKK